MFSLKSGSAISTHNACLCPPMLLALILIGAVPLSTSSLSHQLKTHARTHIQTTHDGKAGRATDLFYSLLASSFLSLCRFFCNTAVHTF